MNGNLKLEIDPKHLPVLLSSLEDSLYQVAIELEKYKGGPNTAERKSLAAKQKTIEEIIHTITEFMEESKRRE